MADEQKPPTLEETQSLVVDIINHLNDVLPGLEESITQLNNRLLALEVNVARLKAAVTTISEEHENDCFPELGVQNT